MELTIITNAMNAHYFFFPTDATILFLRTKNAAEILTNFATTALEQHDEGSTVSARSLLVQYIPVADCTMFGQRLHTRLALELTATLGLQARGTRDMNRFVTYNTRSRHNQSD